MCGSEGKGGGASAGNLLQGAQRCLQGDCHSVADGLRVVCHRVTGTLGKKIDRVLVLGQAREARYMLGILVKSTFLVTTCGPATCYRGQC